jgi:hypothetical protein
MARALLLLVCFVVPLTGIAWSEEATPTAGAPARAWERQGTKTGEEIIGPDGGKMV